MWNWNFDIFIVPALDFLNADSAPERYWRRPTSQEGVRGGGGVRGKGGGGGAEWETVHNARCTASTGMISALIWAVVKGVLTWRELLGAK